MRRISLTFFCMLGLAVAVGLATALSPYASADPDGLERVAEDEGFLETGRLHAFQEDALIPDYTFPGIEDPRLATGVSGFVGTIAVFLVAWGLVALLRRRPARTAVA